MGSQIKSKQRVADHGEVFTRPEEVKAMLDLVKDETEKRTDARYLEPACGSGNFLIEILARRLNHVKKEYQSSQKEYEFYAVLALCGIYGIELLKDNVLTCRKRLLDYFTWQYELLFPQRINNKVIEVAGFILELNILHGDALTMKYAESDEFLRFSQWAAWPSRRPWSLKRHDFRYTDLVHLSNEPYVSIQEYKSCYFLDIQYAKPI